MKDQRLYMTFPNDFHRHPKLSRLSIDARWAFVEMNGEARIADNDGVFSEEEAEFMWPVGILHELANSHPTRPLVVHRDGQYIIREYAKHQQTRADREELRRKRADAGRKGGKVTASAKQVLSNSEQTEAQSESESEDFYSPSKSQSRSNRARVSTDAIEVPDLLRQQAARKGVTSLRAVVDIIRAECSRVVDARSAYQVASWLLDKAPTWPDAPQRYVTGSVRKSAVEVQQYIDESAIGEVA